MGAVAGVAGVAMQGLSLVMGGAAKQREQEEAGIAQARGYEFNAAKSERAAEIGKIQADQIDTAYRDELATTFSNIRAIRASTGGSPDSPSSLAYMGEAAAASDRTRRIKAGGLRMQAGQDATDALFYRAAARSALLGSKTSSLPYILGAASTVATGLYGLR